VPLRLAGQKGGERATEAQGRRSRQMLSADRVERAEEP
jgi:hypothetical protein